MKTKITLTVEIEHEENVSNDTLKENLTTGLKETFWTDELEVIDVEFPTKIAGGVSLFDVKLCAQNNGIELSEDQAEEVLSEYEENYDNSGSGLHGDELIEYCINAQ